MKLLDVLVGLEERGTVHGHDLQLAAFGGTDIAYLTCNNCELDVTVMIIGSYGGWRIEPRIATLDLQCQP